MSSESTDGADGEMAADGSTDAAVLDHLGDGVSRTVLAACAERPRSVGELADHCGVSEATVYRRLDDLTTADLLEQRPRIDSGTVAGGKEYTTAVERIDVSLEHGGIDVRKGDTEDGTPSFTVADPVDDERTVELQLRLPEDRFGEFLSVWAELNDQAFADAAGSPEVLAGSPNCD